MGGVVSYEDIGVLWDLRLWGVNVIYGIEISLLISYLY